MTLAFIALGSNLDDPANQLCRAAIALASLPQSRLDKASSIYRSAAVGPGNQPDYLNAVVSLHTALTPIDLLDALQQIEQQQGRVRDIKWGARTLDLDLLLYGDETINLPRLTVPHPQMRLRHFVLYPLCEIAGEYLILPEGIALDALLTQCPAKGLEKTQFRLATDANALSELPNRIVC
jgi:2-amino-4-hydroxy-6-hydroxymethyldihydropteridine diphosphokinase